MDVEIRKGKGRRRWTSGWEKSAKKSEVRRILSPTGGVYAEIFSRASKLKIERRALEERGKVRARIKKRRQRVARGSRRERLKSEPISVSSELFTLPPLDTP